MRKSKSNHLSLQHFSSQAPCFQCRVEWRGGGGGFSLLYCSDLGNVLRCKFWQIFIFITIWWRERWNCESTQSNQCWDLLQQLQLQPDGTVSFKDLCLSEAVRSETECTCIGTHHFATGNCIYTLFITIQIEDMHSGWLMCTNNLEAQVQITK